MEETRYFVDNDVVFKLAQYELIDEFQIAYDAPSERIYLLDSLKYRAYLHERDRAINFLGHESAYQSICKLVDNSCTASISDELLAEAVELNYPNIDTGELVLLFSMQCEPNSKFVTGDKRAVKAVSENSRFDFCKFRVQTLEQVLLRILERFDFDEIKNKIRAYNEADRAIAICFRSDSLDDVRAGLSSYVNDLKRYNSKVREFLT